MLDIQEQKHTALGEKPKPEQPTFVMSLSVTVTADKPL